MLSNMISLIIINILPFHNMTETRNHMINIALCLAGKSDNSKTQCSIILLHNAKIKFNFTYMCLLLSENTVSLPLFI